MRLQMLRLHSCIFGCVSMRQQLLGLHVARCHVQLLQLMLALPVSGNAYLSEGIHTFQQNKQLHT